MTISAVSAVVSCSLGTLISGNIADDSLELSGIIRCRGTLEISGTITPEVGTVVTITYVKSGTTRTIPRKLRVLSSFANPRTRTTSVQVGCKLTLLSDLTEPTEEQLVDTTIANQGVPPEWFLDIPVAITAEWALNYCLDKLGITAPVNPLTSRFSMQKFAFDRPYVDIMSDLLMSESYVGFLDADEELRVRDLTVEAESGPLLVNRDVLELDQIGTGNLPGEAVVVRYTAVRYNIGGAAGFGLSGNGRLTWQRAIVTSSPSLVNISYSDANGSQTYVGEYTPSSTTLTTYQAINGGNLPISREETATAIVSKVAGGFVSQRLSAGVPFTDSVTTSVTTTTYQYNSEGDVTREESTVKISPLELAGKLNVPFVFSASDFVDLSTSASIISEKTVVERLYSGSSVQVVTSRYLLWPLTQEGQQATAEGGQTFANATEVADYISQLGLANLTLDSVNVSIERASYSLRSGFTVADEYNAQAALNGDPENNYQQESRTTFEWITGSATTLRRVEFSMPYAPHDYWTAGGPLGYTSSDGGAPAKALQFGRVQNRLRLGNRQGLSIRCVPEKVPPRPFDAFYVQLNGLTVAYRVNRLQWSFSAEGIVCSVDAAYWGVVGAAPGYDLGTAWVPLAPGTTSLPEAPAGTSDATYGTILDPTAVLPPYKEVPELRADRAGDYRLTGQDASLLWTRRLVADAGSYTLTGRDAGLSKGFGLAADTGSYALTGQDAALVRIYVLTADPGSYALTGEDANLVLDTGFYTLTAETGSYVLTGQDATLAKTAPATWQTGTSGITYSNSNRTATATSTAERTLITTSAKSSGKWYFEVSITSTGIEDVFYGLTESASFYPGQSGSGGTGTTNSRNISTFNRLPGSSATSSAPSHSSPVVAMCAVDFDAKRLWYGSNGTWIASGNPAAGTNASVSAWSNSPTLYAACRLYYNSGVASLPNTTPTYSPPTGFALWTD